MSVTADEIVTAAIQLPESDRLAIVSRLLETMGEEDILQSVDDADFIAEMRGRRDDPTGAVEWSQLRDED
jgi:hypothetical protein